MTGAAPQRTTRPRPHRTPTPHRSTKGGTLS